MPIMSASQQAVLGQQKMKEKLSDSLKSCNEILKELFSKKHSVCLKQGLKHLIYIGQSMSFQ